MNSAQQLLTALASLDSNTISADAPRRVTVDSHLGEWEVILEQSDALAYSFLSLALACPTLRGKTNDQLKQISQQIADQLQYLLEPIALIECDLEASTMQVRSNPPSAEPDRTRCYYELLVKQHGLSLKRYQVTPSASRTPIAMTLTKEQLRRICNDFEDVILPSQC